MLQVLKERVFYDRKGGYFSYKQYSLVDFMGKLGIQGRVHIHVYSRVTSMYMCVNRYNRKGVYFSMRSCI